MGLGLPETAKAVTFIVTRDRDAAKAFYQGILGLTLKSEDDFATVFDMNGTMLRISKVEGHVPQSHTVLGWEVPAIVAVVEALREQEVQFVIYDGFGQDAQGIWTAPGGNTKVAWFKDPDGNILSLTQFENG